MIRRPTGDDPFENAECRRPEHVAWSRKHRASKWDYVVDGENDLQSATRRRATAALCGQCPVKHLCDLHHRKNEKKFGFPDPGIWAGKIYKDYPAKTQSDPNQLELGDAA